MERPMILIDLAVPRDIDPEIRKKDNITLYDMDSFRTGETPKELADNLEAAGAIVKAQMNEFFQWLVVISSRASRRSKRMLWKI